ncbi:hypothetical protein M0R45_026962 [Rubus argutus]|uniref:Fatty acyl-CoA reductase n=1 Tax=Rubus argutus TaxID=59490 RepID=A0AAW1WZH3_RUBAR
MELKNIQGCLENKTIFVTGATGLLGMVFVEKILRVQPNVEKLYLLIRASDANTATHRMHNEITRKELFKDLKEKWGADFDSFILEKIPPSINFDERYDVALDVNTFGVLHVLSFAQKCLKLEILVHISTAYV